MMHFMYILVIVLSALCIQGILDKHFDESVNLFKAHPMMSAGKECIRKNSIKIIK